MPTTDPTFGWPLPELADPPAGPQQLADLAAGIAATIEDSKVRTNSGFGGPYVAVFGATATLSINSGQAFGSLYTLTPSSTWGQAFTDTPIAVACIAGGGDNKVSVKVENRAADSIGLRLFHPTGTSGSNYSSQVAVIAIGTVAS